MKTALITGATSGIGLEFARRYAAEGYRLILVGRRTERMDAFEKETGATVRKIAKDISTVESCKELLNEVSDEAIDIFINNAGFGDAGEFIKADLEKEIRMISVNDMAMHILFKGILLQMERRGSGRILNVASSAGLLPAGPYMATYYASKAYVASLTRAVAYELKQSNSSIYVGALCPGPVDTEFNQNADVIFALKGITVQTCVDICLKEMKKNRVIITPTLRMKAANFFQHIMPMPLLLRIIAHQQKKKIYS